MSASTVKEGVTEQLGWAILELMGHRKLAGVVEEATVAGGAFLRIDVYTEDPDLTGKAPIATQFYSAAAVYCITPSAKEMCLALSKSHQPAPVARWELPEQVESRGDEIAQGWP